MQPDCAAYLKNCRPSPIFSMKYGVLYFCSARNLRSTT